MKVFGAFGFGVAIISIFLALDAKEEEYYKDTKYLNGGSLEPITLYVKENPDSATTFARKAVLLRRPKAKSNIVLCHGYGCDKFDTAMLRFLFNNHNVLSFDFRAHGEKIDERQCCTFGKDEAYDVMAAAQFFKNDPEFQSLPLGVYGFSMGAVASIHAQAQQPNLFDYMVLDCPYNTTENVIKTGLDAIRFNIFGYTFGLPGKALLQRSIYHPTIQAMVKGFLKAVSHLDATATNTYIYPLSPSQLIKKISVPCFFIHCREDEKVTTAAAYELFSGARGYKRLWITNGRRHFDSFFYNPEKYAYKINKFIKKVLSGDIKQKQKQKVFEDAQMG